MQNNRGKTFWAEAARGGTIIGLVVVGFDILGYALASGEVASWNTLLGVLRFLLFALLIYGFTRRMAARSGEEGFSYGRGLGFVVSMMLFVGVIVGLWIFVHNRFLAPESVQQMIDAAAALMQDLYSQEEFDSVYDTYSRMMVSPLALVLISIVRYVLYGGLVGLFVSLATRRPADPFGGNGTREGERNSQDDERDDD